MREAAAAVTARRVLMHPTTRRFGRYALVSVVNVVVGQGILVLGFDGLHWTARAATVVATALATGPAYLMSRAWVWRRSGPGHLGREVLPFWVLAFIGMVIAILLAGPSQSLARHFTSHRAERTLFLMAATLTSYGVVWVVRFVALDRLVFPEPSPS
jgi:putative flippase GtrA